MAHEIGGRVRIQPSVRASKQGRGTSALDFQFPRTKSELTPVSTAPLAIHQVDPRIAFVHDWLMPPTVEPWPSSRAVRIGVQLHPQQGTFAQLRDAAVAAEEIGVDLVMNWDHFWPLYGDPQGRHYECWTTLAAWAEATSRVQLGPLVSCVAYRSPALLSELARTVSDISGGRLVLGLGAGWLDRDFEWLGVPFQGSKSRPSRVALRASHVYQSAGKLFRVPPSARMGRCLGTR